MRHIARFIALLAVLGSCGGVCVGAGAENSGSLPTEETVVKLAPGQRLFSLGKGFIFEGSLSLTADGRTMEAGVDYLVDLTSGTVYLRRALPDTATAKASFVCLPFELKENYVGPVPWKREVPGLGSPSWTKLSHAGGGTGSSRAAGVVPSGTVGRDQRPSITVGGSKRLAVEFGTGRDVAFSQSLDLNITGKVSRDVELKAVLSDRNLPLLPEGNTQTLEELDEVMIAISSPSLQATFGDYTLAGPSTEFGGFTRSVEGVQASAVRGDQEISVATASSRGKFSSVEFMGEEGKQGAYFVTGGTAGVTLVPGGEKVWLDGELMRRGAAADYVIDYGAGTITFTSGRPITKDSRITVDYEYSQEAYRRSLHSAVGRTSSGPFRVTASYAVEKDDRGSKIGGAITEEDRLRFEAEGDGAADASVPDTTAGGGSNVELEPPSSHELVDVAMDYKPWDGFSLETEVAMSDLDLNTYSGLDDGDNRGTAFSLKASLSPKSLSVSGASLGSIEASASFRETESTFAAMGRTRPAMDYDRWILSPSGPSSGEGRAEMAVTYRPNKKVAVGAEMGRLAVRGGPESQVVRFISSASGRRGYLLRWERAETEEASRDQGRASRDRALARLRWGVGPMAPLVEIETERRSSPQGLESDYRKVGSEIAASGRGAVTRAALYVREDFRTIGGERSRESRSLTQSYGVSYRGASRTGMEGRYSLRSLSIDSTGAQVNTYVAYFDGIGSALSGALGGRGTYEVTSTDEGPRTVVFVGPGKGHYDSDGRYVGLGDYELADDEGPRPLSSRVTVSLSADLDWGRAGRSNPGGFFDRMLSHVRSSGLYRSDEHTRLPVAAPSHILRPSSYMSTSDIIRGTSVARGEIEVFPRGRLLSPRLRYEVRRKLRNASGSAASGHERRLFSLRLRTRAVPRGTFEAEQVWGRSSTHGTYAQTSPGVTSETKATITLRAGPRTSFAVRSFLLRETSSLYGAVSRWGLEPSASYSSPGRAGVEARCSWAKAGNSGSRSYDELLGWLGDRVDYSLSGQIVLGGGMTFTGALRGSGVSWSDLSHYLRMEMRALF